MLYSYPIRARSTPYTLAKKIHNLFKKISLKERNTHSIEIRMSISFSILILTTLVFPLILSRAGSYALIILKI